MRDSLGVLPRLAAQPLRQAITLAPVVAVMGARGTGRSHLVQSLGGTAEHFYLTLDDLEVRMGARSRPDELVHLTPRLVIDEVQREPGVIAAIRRALDTEAPADNGRFILTSCADLRRVPAFAAQLEGRTLFLSVWPFTRSEQIGLGVAGLWGDLLDAPFSDWLDIILAEDTVAHDWRELVKRGGYPAPALELPSDEARQSWFRSYLQSYLERDLQSLASIENLADFHRLMRAASLHIGEVINQADLARDTGISAPTVYRYLNLLEASYQIIRVEPYTFRRTKRLVRSPRLYWGDTGLAMFLAGEEIPRPEHLENLILTDLIAWRDAQLVEVQVLHWRTHLGEKVDFVIESEGRLLPIQVRAEPQVGPDDAHHLSIFLEQYRDAVIGGLVLHTGGEVFRLADRILAVPWWRVL